MYVRLRIVGTPAQPQTQPAPARPRPLGFFCSLAMHAAVFAFLLMPGADTAASHNTYTALIVPLEKDHKLIWYQFKEQLPEVSPTNPTAAEQTRIRTPQRARQQIVTAPQADPGKQFVWIPAPQIKLKEDLSAPNLIALQPAVVPAPEKPQTKAFHAPEPPKPQQPAPPTALPSAPSLPSKQTPAPNVEALLNKAPAQPRREFAPPAISTAPAPAPAVALPSAPTLETSRPTGSVDSILGTPMARPRREFTPPPAPPANPQTAANPTALPSAPALEATRGSAGVSVAILGLNPSNAPQMPTPDGGRPARIAAGPDPGNDQPQLVKGNSSLSLPDVSIQGKPGPSIAAVTRPKTIFNKPGLGTAPIPATQSASLQSTSRVSVPQWPSSRSLPAVIERRFHTRVVYTTVLPASEGSDDWVVWFAEEAPTPADTRSLMRPPTLMHAAPLPPVPANEDHGTGKLLIAGVLRKDGHFGSFSQETDAANRELLEMLQSWQFNPAMRNGVPVDVEAVLEIPMVYAAANLAAPK